jgi:hypothetical protein
MEQLLQMDCFSSATSLDHWPDLPPLKVSLSVVNPMRLLLTTRVVKRDEQRAAILNLDLASISRLNLELFNHKGHQMGPTLKEEILGQGCEVMKEGFSGGQGLANSLVGEVDEL